MESRHQCGAPVEGDSGVFDACDTIVAATDASREGEMLFRYLYRFLGCRKPCLRLWISSLTDEAIAKGMENLRPCSLFDNLFLAADSRNKADWLLGVNSSYAVCKAVGFGNNSLGRVQTPVLAAISGRYRERENHIPADSWPVFVSLCKNGKIIKMRHVEDFCNRGMPWNFTRTARRQDMPVSRRSTAGLRKSPHLPL